MEHQNLIYYPGGCYGTFTEWLVNYFDGVRTSLPFNENGNSHKFKGNFFIPKEKLFEHIRLNNKFKFSRIHPNLFEGINQNKRCHTYGMAQVIIDDIEFLIKHFNKILILYPDSGSVLWKENNGFTKSFLSDEVFNEDYSCLGYQKKYLPSMHFDIIDRLKAYIQIEVDTENIRAWNKGNVDDFGNWELRELLSLYWFSRSEVEISSFQYAQKSIVTNDVIFIPLSSIKSDFKNYIKTVLSFFEIDMQNVSDHEIEYIRQEWLKKQFYINRDNECQTIVNKILNQEDYSWEHISLSIIDEAWIQKTLRDRGFEIKCYNLNILPKNTRDFCNLLEKL